MNNIQIHIQYKNLGKPRFLKNQTANYLKEVEIKGKIINNKKEVRVYFRRSKKMFKGTAASPGIVLGKALVLEHNELVIEKKSISDVETEIARLNEAVAISKTELEK